MITPYTVTSLAWVQISNAGESGTCWAEKSVNGGGKLRIYHSTLGTPGLDKVNHGYPVWVPNKNFDATQLVPDAGGLDVFYAIAEGDENTSFLLNVDVA